MKKLFFYAAAALAMLASCQKAEISGSKSDVDDSQPAAIQFGIDAPSLTVTKTKAAVTEWANSEVFVYGLLQEGRNGGHTVNALGSGRYDLADAYIKDYQTVAVSGIKSNLAVYAEPTAQVPYFYVEGETYDFFGYHLGGATKGIVDSTSVVDQVTVGVKIDGASDVMVAYADKVADIKENATEPMGEDDVYSAWAARRGVQPTLKFQHALSRFNIIVRGMNSRSEKVTIEDISVEAQDSLNLIVVGANNKLGATGVGDKVALALKNDDAARTTFTDYDVIWGNTAPAGGANACFMLAPNMSEVKFTVLSSNNEYAHMSLPPQTVTAKASELVKWGDGLKDAEDRELLGATVFEAGKAYNIYINVYGPEKIEITAELTEWKEGGDFVYDPDKRPGDGNNDITPDKVLLETVSARLPEDATEEDYEAQLPAWYVTGHPYNEAKTSFPWVGEVGDYQPGTYTIQVKYKGDAVDLTPNFSLWPAGTTYDNVSKKMSFELTDPATYIGFELEAELGGDKVNDNLEHYEIFIMYEHVFTQILNEESAQLATGATAEEYAAQLPAWYVEQYPYAGAQASFPWVATTFEPVKAGTPIVIQVLNSGTPVELDPEKINWSGATIADDRKSMTVVKPRSVSYAGFEVVRELGLTEADLPNLVVKVTIE